MKKYLVTGSPGSGKSTYVKEHHGDNDIIFDWDDMFVAVTGMKSHSEGTEGQQHVVNRLRYDLIRAADGADSIETLWMIASKATDEITEALGEYEEIHLDVSPDEAKSRVDNDDSRDDKDFEHEKIDKYFGEERAMPIKADREYRNLGSFEFREEDERVTGYAATFDTYFLYSDGEIELYEKIARDAFEGTDMSDVVFLRDHTGAVLARTKNGSVELSVTDRGLFTSSDLTLTEAARAMKEDIRVGNYTQMSFSFVIESEHIDWLNDTTAVRVIDKVRKLYDVSAVAFPANPYTEIGVSARAILDGAIEERTAERLEAEKRQRSIRALALRLKLERNKTHGN